MRRTALPLLAVALLLLLLANAACEKGTVDRRYEDPSTPYVRYSVASLDGRVELQWNENLDPNFVAYELYRANQMPVTQESTRIFSSRDRARTSFVDDTPKASTTLYYKLYVSNDQLRTAGGNDVVVRIPSLTDPGICGFIAEDTVFDLATSPVIVKGDLTVKPNVTLTIMPGVEVRFLSRDTLSDGRYPDRPELIVQGALRVAGENGRPVRFVSGSTILEKGNWGGIWFANSTGGSNNRIEFAIIQHAREAIRIDRSELALYNTRIEHASETGLAIENGRVTAASLILSDIGSGAGFGVKAGAASILHLTNSIVSHIAGTAVYADGLSANIRNNVIAFADAEGLAVMPAGIENAANNIVYECRTGLRKLALDAEGKRADYNDYYHLVRVGYETYVDVAPGSHDRADLPDFVSPDWNTPQLGDFTLNAASPLRHAGQAGGPIGLANPLSVGVTPQ